MYNNLLVLLDWVNNGYKPEFLDLISWIAIFFAVSVITIKNPISSLMSLIGLFGCISVYLILVGFNFIGFSYLIVYIGAISILFLFILMLINIRRSELVSNNVNSVPLGLLIIILLNYSWTQVSFSTTDDLTNNVALYNSLLNELTNTIWNFFSVSSDQNNIFFITSNNWDGVLAETSHIVSIGTVLYTTLNMWLLLAGLILLLAMVGCIVITTK